MWFTICKTDVVYYYLIIKCTLHIFLPVRPDQHAPGGSGGFPEEEKLYIKSI